MRLRNGDFDSLEAAGTRGCTGFSCVEPAGAEASSSNAFTKGDEMDRRLPLDGANGLAEGAADWTSAAKVVGLSNGLDMVPVWNGLVVDPNGPLLAVDPKGLNFGFGSVPNGPLVVLGWKGLNFGLESAASCEVFPAGRPDDPNGFSLAGLVGAKGCGVADGPFVASEKPVPKTDGVGFGANGAGLRAEEGVLPAETNRLSSLSSAMFSVSSYDRDGSWYTVRWMISDKVCRPLFFSTRFFEKECFIRG